MKTLNHLIFAARWNTNYIIMLPAFTNCILQSKVSDCYLHSFRRGNNIVVQWWNWRCSCWKVKQRWQWLSTWQAHLGIEEPLLIWDMGTVTPGECCVGGHGRGEVIAGHEQWRHGVPERRVVEHAPERPLAARRGAAPPTTRAGRLSTLSRCSRQRTRAPHGPNTADAHGASDITASTPPALAVKSKKTATRATGSRLATARARAS